MTYTDLLAALAAYALRTDQTPNWPTNVVLGEARLNRLLNCRQMVTTITGNFSGATVALPVDFNGVKALRLIGGCGTKLTPVSVDRMDELKSGPGDNSGDPVYFAVTGSNIEVFPEPATPDPYQLTYYAQIPALATAETNWLLTAYPDAYLYASLMAFGIMAQDVRLSAWQTELSAIIAEIADNDMGAVYGDRLQPDPVSVTP